MKLPSLNEYVRACRSSKYAGASFKKRYQEKIALFVSGLPRFDYPVRIAFHWIEENRRRDFDNVAFAKKFILDTLVAEKKLKDDNRRFVNGFTDSFEYGEEPAVILTIERSDNDTE